MKRSKALIPVTVISVIFIGIIIYMLLPKNIARDPVSDIELEQAYSQLNGDLTNKRYSYEDFLRENSSALSASELTAEASPSAGETELDGGKEIAYEINAPADGLYELHLDCLVPENSYMNYSLSIKVNGSEQFFESRNIDIPVLWRDTTKEFPLDRYGDETASEQENITGWRSVGIYNTTYLSDTPLLFKLNKGVNTVTISNATARTLGIGKLTAKTPERQIPYAEYINSYSDTNIYDGLYEVNAISYASKNSSWVQVDSSTNPSVTPTDAVYKKVNILYLDTAGGEATYEVDVPESALYSFAMHAIPYNEDFCNFVSVKIDGKAPFAEALSLPVYPNGDTGWHHELLADKDGNPYMIYLTEGKHELSLRAEVAPVRSALNDLQFIVDHLNNFSLEITKITGRETDKNRTWKLTRYITDTAEILDSYDILIRHILYSLSGYSIKGMNASMLADLNDALLYLDLLREDPDELPLYLEILSGNTASVLQALSSCLDDLLGQGVELDMLYLYGKKEQLPQENAGILTNIGYGLKQVMASFFSPKYEVRNQGDSINVWVNRTVLHADALQKLADTRFAEEYDQNVNVSVMPDVNKLVLACAAGTQPDIAMAVQSHITYDLASRGALLDLTSFNDFWSTAANSVPGAYTGVVFNEGVYGLPEAVDFYALVYREDIFNQLGIEPPDTWDDVCKIMSELQRYSMSFYHPIANMDGYKWFYQTVPLIYQYGGNLYSENGQSTVINEPNAIKGISMLGELFTTYALVVQVPSFFSSFRFGQTPAGLIDLNNYLILKRGAPELTGQWKLAPNIGTVQEDGSVARWYVNNVQSAIMFKETNKPAKSWDFMKWWMSEEIQTQYAFNLHSTYGIYWLSANMDAIKNAPIAYEDLKVILETVQWIRDTPRSPGQYMLERKISDIWNKMVSEGITAQVAIDISIIDIQREFKRKMTEFGLLGGDEPVEYHVREIDWVKEKMDAATS